MNPNLCRRRCYSIDRYMRLVRGLTGSVEGRKRKIYKRRLIIVCLIPIETLGVRLITLIFEFSELRLGNRHLILVFGQQGLKYTTSLLKTLFEHFIRSIEFRGFLILLVFFTNKCNMEGELNSSV